ncbi:MAG: hypothetical protein HOJ50_12985 [Proteobacteria bacterium]|nr:hypothetical protein [Pseudomonadota bacterium]
MLRISCPFCGVRDHSEFSYGGDASVEYPARPQSTSCTPEGAARSPIALRRDFRAGIRLQPIQIPSRRAGGIRPRHHRRN